MMKGILIVSFACMMMLAACTTQGASDNQNRATACTFDAKICPDGSAVGRDSTNNCEFFPCATYSREYIRSTLEECETLHFVCAEGTEQFSDEYGCGCQSLSPMMYMSTSTDQCASIRYTCPNTTVPFSDSTGCGCDIDWEAARPIEQNACPSKDTIKKMCVPEEAPVCGWIDKPIDCTGYPCTATYADNCVACADEKVTLWTEGECPQ